MTTLNTTLVRHEFPSLSNGFVFLDNAGGSQTLRAVADRISEYLLTSDVQHGASYQVSQLAKQRVTEAREAMATYVNAQYADEVVIGASATMLLRILSICLSQTFAPGDEIIVTNTDHEANVSPWVDLEKQGFVVKIWNMNPSTMQLEIDDLLALMTDKTRLVALTHASNVLGTINPIKAIAKVVHEYQALICVDGVAYAPHRAIDVQDLDVDFYVFSLYKVYGPHQGLLYGKRAHLINMPGLNHYFIAADDLPYKFQPGGVNYELSYSTMGIVDYLQRMAEAHGVKGNNMRESIENAFDLFTAHEAKLTQRLMDYLTAQPNITIIGIPNGNAQQRVSTVAFVVNDWKSDAITLKVDPHNIGIRFGDFYAKKLIESLGLEAQNGVVRVSMVHYNTFEEIDRLIEVFKTIF